MAKDIDWVSIQSFYDEGHTWREVTDKFGVTPTTLSRANKTGKFKSRNISEGTKLSIKKNPRKHSQETKDKISKSVLRFLEENPHMVGFVKNHWTKRKSWAEQRLEKALISANIIGFEFNYQNGIYCYDFAWVDKKLDVEVDGNTHLIPKVKTKDERRDRWTTSQGWTVLRFTAKDIKNNLNQVVDEIKNHVIN